MGTVSNVRTKNENTIVIMLYLILQPIFDCSDKGDSAMLVTLLLISMTELGYIPCVKI